MSYRKNSNVLETDLDKNGVMTLLGRKVQKEIGLDSGIYRRLAIAPDNVQENLDNMLGELGKI